MLSREKSKIQRLNSLVSREITVLDEADFYTTRLDDPEDIDAAEQLRYETYIERGVILDPAKAVRHIGKNAIIYGGFAKCDNLPDKQLVVTGRILRLPEGISSSQMHLEDLDAGWPEKLGEVPADQIVEVSGLAKAHELTMGGSGVGTVAAIAMLAQMMHDSRDMGITTWVCGLEKKIAPGLECVWGEVVMRRMGKEVRMGEYPRKYAPYCTPVEASLNLFKNPRPIDEVLGRSAIFAMIDQLPSIMKSRNRL